MGTNVALLTGGQGINNVQSTGDQFRYQGMDPDDALEQQALNRRQHIANLLIQQGLAGSGTGQMVGRFYVPPSPVQGLADLAKVGVGAYGTYKNDEARSELSTKNQQAMMDALNQYFGDKSGGGVTPSAAASPPTSVAEMPPAAPAPPQQPPVEETASPSIFKGGYQMGPDESGWAPKGPIQDLNAAPAQPSTAPPAPPVPAPGPVSPGTPAPANTTEDNRRKLIMLMANQNPRIAAIGQFIAQQEAAKAEKATNREWQQGESALNREARSADAKLQLDAMVANKLITQEQANNLLAQNQKLHDERMGTEKERDRKNALAVKEMEVEARKDGKVPPGYRTTPDGNLEAVPGGPADTKLQGVLNLDTSMLQNSNASFDRLAESANQILNHPGLAGITGVRGAIPDVPGTQAADARALLNKLKSQVGFGVLQEMRNNSKSGGALGSVSDAEGKRLENNLASVESAQSIDQMKRELQGIVDYATGAKDRLREAFNMKHKQGEPPAAMQPKGMTPSVPSFHDPEKQKRYEEFKKNHKP